MTIEILPSFAKPPVVETVLGIQFAPLPAFTNAHLGAFWKTLGSQWPVVADAPPLPNQLERFGEERAWSPLGMLNLMLTQQPISRVQIRNAQRDRMIQLQNGQIHYNWLGSGDQYPRYEVLRQEFASVAERMIEFLKAEALGELRPNQWELIYINHLLRGELWSGPNDWGRLFRVPPIAPARMADTILESINGEWHYEIPDRRGRLHVQIQHGKKEESGPEVLILTLTARGPVKGDEDFMSGLNLGRATIVRGFAELCSDEALKHWEILA